MNMFMKSYGHVYVKKDNKHVYVKNGDEHVFSIRKKRTGKIQ